MLETYMHISILLNFINVCLICAVGHFLGCSVYIVYLKTQISEQFGQTGYRAIKHT